MKIEWLETVMQVAKTCSFSEASELIPCSQSSVSRQVRSAEDELGVILFHRSSNSNLVTLTSSGEDLLPAIQKLLDDYKDLQQCVQNANAQRKAPLILGVAGQTFSSSSRATLISLLYLKHPEIQLQFLEMSLPSYSYCVETLINEKADALLYLKAFAAGSMPQLPQDDSELGCIPLGVQSLSIAFGENFAPADRSGITFSQLFAQRFIFHTDICKTSSSSITGNRHSLFVEACRQAGFEPKLLIVDRHLADIKQVLAAQGQGVFPSSIPPFLREYPGLCYIPVRNAPYYVQYSLMYLKKNRNPGIQKLAAFLREGMQMEQ